MVKEAKEMHSSEPSPAVCKTCNIQLLKVAREFKELSKLGKSPEKRLLKIVYRVLKLK